MIVGSSDDIPEIHGLIIIDAYEPNVEDKKYLNDFYQKIIQQCHRFKFKSIVNSPTNCRIDYNDVSQLNTFKQYSWNSTERSIFDDWVIFNLIRYSRNQETTAEIFKQTLLNRDTSIFIVDVNDFLYHCDTKLNGQCTNWLVVGQTWQMCTHQNNLSLQSLRKINRDNLNFYATEYSFCKINGDCANFHDFDRDEYGWEVINRFGFRLLPSNKY